MTMKAKLERIIFESDTPSGKAFDVILIWAIVASILVVLLDSVQSLNDKYHDLFLILEWVFTVLFTVEYVLRVAISNKPKGYIFSFLGVIDLISVLPTYLSLLVAGPQYLIVIRGLRILRVFRVMKLYHYSRDGMLMMRALISSSRKISVFILSILILVTILGSLMYVIEGEESGFKDIPNSIYWAIVTLSTVGYGDISPETPVGKMLASVIMLLGYGIIAVPTGIVTSEFVYARKDENNETKGPICSNCGAEGHVEKANHCFNCGASLRIDSTKDT
ncbi:MAG: ion transporter [Flavobacteriia bacterium]|nr:ion transporter [Flavobacteriia bacterium]